MVATPLSQVDADALVRWVESKKQLASTIDADLKDAKRRVTSVKPRKKRAASAVNPDDSDDGDASGGDSS